MSQVPWPWPLAPLVLLVLLGLATLVLYGVYHFVIRGTSSMGTMALPQGARPRSLPILVGFRRQLLPALLVLWAALIVAYLVTERDYLWTILPWASVTTIMLWPVGRELKRPYLSYRTPLFLLGVLSMAYIPFAGFFLLGTHLSFGVKSVIFFGLVADITVLGIVPGLRWAIGRPLEMFFRPDLLFGDGRVLATGIIALVLGLRYIWGSPAMGVTWPIPKWDWYAIFFAIVVGLIPLIAVRGVLKLLMRFRRLRDGRWAGWPAVIVREGFLVVTALSVGYGFHNAFMGARPFTAPIFTTDPDFWPAVLITLAGAGIIILGRGALKKAIGDPFIRETVRQSFAKHSLLVLGLVVMFYGFMSVISMDPMHTKAGVNGLRTWSNMARVWPVGVPLVVWGLIMLIPLRVLIERYQRHAIVAQMAAVILPHQRPEQRRRLVSKMMIGGLLEMPFPQRRGYMATMNRALAGAPDGGRATMTQTMVDVLADLPKTQRDTLIETNAAALGTLTSEERVTRMTDMMTAVAGLPEEQRRDIMEKMASMLA